jgi:cyclopropane-fatty-acyl-phospholipid synthase
MLWATQKLIAWVDQDRIPDPMIRLGIRSLLRERLASLPLDNPEAGAEYLTRFISAMADAPIAPVPEKANEQHYELPATFFGHVLGARRKYSSCHWPEGINSLDSAEIDALRLTCERAGISDGQTILELGCGWGSLSLWMAEHYPTSRITVVSNSHSQRAYILERALALGLTNLEVITCDMNDFNIDTRFNRVVSVEMFEHMRNWHQLFSRVAEWLKPGGIFFMHIFCHRTLPYEYASADERDWMGHYFFAGGIMPSYDLPLHFQEHLKLTRRWCWNGRHYEKTANAWLANMDAHKTEIWPILAETYGADAALTWWVRWRIFFMACAELWGYRDGKEWWVGHYRFEKPKQ